MIIICLKNLNTAFIENKERKKEKKKFYFV